MTDAEGYVTTFTYDAMDRVVTMTDAKGGVTRYTYTDRGEVATKTAARWPPRPTLRAMSPLTSMTATAIWYLRPIPTDIPPNIPTTHLI